MRDLFFVRRSSFLNGARIETLAFWLIVTLVGAHFTLGYTWNLPAAFSYIDYVPGNVGWPFRTRRLMAWIFRGALLLVHELGLDGRIRNPLSVTLAVCVFASIVGTALLIRKLILQSYPETPRLQWLSLLVPYMAYFNYLLTPEIRVQTPYDVPSVFFFALALYGMYRKSRPLVWLAFVLGTLNRETAIFIALQYCIWESPRTRKWLEWLPTLCEGALMGGAWVLIRAWCVKSVGEGAYKAEVTIPLNLHFLVSPWHWPTLASVYGFLWVLLIARWRYLEDCRLRRMAVLLPVWFLVMILRGDLLEIRIHSEWIPYLCMCIVQILFISNNIRRVGDVTFDLVMRQPSLKG